MRFWPSGCLAACTHPIVIGRYLYRSGDVGASEVDGHGIVGGVAVRNGEGERW